MLEPSPKIGEEGERLHLLPFISSGGANNDKMHCDFYTPTTKQKMLPTEF